MTCTIGGISFGRICYKFFLLCCVMREMLLQMSCLHWKRHSSQPEGHNICLVSYEVILLTPLPGVPTASWTSQTPRQYIGYFMSLGSNAPKKQFKELSSFWFTVQRTQSIMMRKSWSWEQVSPWWKVFYPSNMMSIRKQTGLARRWGYNSQRSKPSGLSWPVRPNFPQTAPPARDQVFRYISLLGIFNIQTIILRYMFSFSTLS